MQLLRNRLRDACRPSILLTSSIVIVPVRIKRIPSVVFTVYLENAPAFGGRLRGLLKPDKVYLGRKVADEAEMKELVHQDTLSAVDLV